MPLPETFNSIRLHDEAFFNWLGGLRVEYGNIGGTLRNNVPILVVGASPGRAFAAVADLLVSRGWINGATAQEMRTNAEAYDIVPLPIASVQFNDPLADVARSGVPKLCRVTNTAGTEAATYRYWTYTREYVTTFWCGKRYTELYIREWLISQFGSKGRHHNETFVDVVYPGIGTQHQSMKLQGTSDESQLEGVDERIIRFAATFVMNMMIMKKFADETT